MRPSRCLGPDDPQEILRGAGKGLTVTAATDETAAARVSIESFMAKKRWIESALRWKMLKKSSSGDEEK